MTTTVCSGSLDNQSTDENYWMSNKYERGITMQSGKEAWTSSSHRHSQSAMKVLKYWLMVNMNDSRNIETIDAIELDTILAKYFMTVRRVDSSDYKPSALKNLRTGIEYYLKAIGYPFSITKSREFLPSQHAYKQRINDLVRAGHKGIS